MLLRVGDLNRLCRIEWCDTNWQPLSYKLHSFKNIRLSSVERYPGQIEVWTGDHGVDRATEGVLSAVAHMAECFSDRDFIENFTIFDIRSAPLLPFTNETNYAVLEHFHTFQFHNTSQLCVVECCSRGRQENEPSRRKLGPGNFFLTTFCTENLLYP